ncbi:hypothetical protein H6P81_003289 [Aristolochia fimbriata]|uniref:Peptidase S54 rhomboid domain-containing protein n=1 Tax=Aristolochia fimbriata TaxID=158543 RepID=A0AAV7FD85_ARIFI|nr:hypothetical protein H6P81_003289 [Aristolochia fimbriata]
MQGDDSNQEQGISVLNNAIKACTEDIERLKGKLVLKEAPRTVSKRDDKLLAEHMAKLLSTNEEVSGDEESEEEDIGMGDRDVKRVNGKFWILLLHIGIYVAGHWLQLRGMKALYLYHAYPEWFQFITAAFCHASWNHLSINLFFLYIFGKLVEEEEGNVAKEMQTLSHGWFSPEMQCQSGPLVLYLDSLIQFGQPFLEVKLPSEFCL